MGAAEPVSYCDVSVLTVKVCSGRYMLGIKTGWPWLSLYMVQHESVFAPREF